MSKITESARGEDCLVYAPGVDWHNKDTVVYSHLNGAGMGRKNSDLFGCYACYHCHAWLDKEWARWHTREDRDNVHNAAIIRTQIKLLEKGLIKIGNKNE